ncbi:MAG: magnesium transporter CorA family protein [Eubacterium sp.]|nr:magnesium transporter CorA family protein [Eubacterium sp.]
MRTIYKTDNGVLSQKEMFEPDVWVNLISPNMDELMEAAKYYDIDIADLRAALDEEESSRVQIEDGYTLILVDIPLEEIRNDQRAYTTIPLGILLVQDAILTVCGEDTAILNYFYNNRMRGFSTKKKMRFVYQILLRTTNLYQALLRVIDKKRSEIEKRVGTETTEDKDLINLHELETNLVYFATSLSANKVVLDRLTRYERIKQYPEDKELLDDVIVENRQAIEMTNIYRDIIHGARDLVSTIINNRLNNVMKFLTSITLVMAIPTIISGIYGMNVSGKWMPLSETPHGFAIICIATSAICVIALLVLKRRKML